MTAIDDSADRLAAGEVRDRAAGGAALLGVRGLLVYALGVVANVALARLLAPRDFGIFALGMVVVLAGTLLAEGGLAGALIKRSEPPQRPELESVSAVQLGATSLLAAAVGIAAIPLGRDAELIAVIAVSLPLAMLRAPTMLVLERDLQYRLIATTDLIEALVFYGAAIGMVAAGLGVWGLAAAVPLRALVGSSLLIVRGPLGLVVPRWSWPLARPLLGFGLRFQAGSLVAVTREQAVNIGVGAVAGLGTLGIWALAWRVLQIPALLFQTVGRVAFPAMSRLLGADADPRPVLERQVPAVGALNAVVLAGLVGFAPALPTIIGHEWNDVPAVLLWSGVALVLGSPLVVSAAGFLFAAGRPGVVVVATAVSGLVWLGVALPLLDSVGAAAVGIGWTASAVVNAAMLWRPVAAQTGARIGRSLAPVTLVALGALGVGWFVGHAPEEPLVGGVAGMLAAELVLLGGLLAVSRQTLRELGSLGRRGLRSLRGPAG